MPLQCFGFYCIILCVNQFAPMVKWLRRRPLTAESGVRVPLGVPIKKSAWTFFLSTRELTSSVCLTVVNRTPW